jgi:hypothetical protein
MKASHRASPASPSSLNPQPTQKPSRGCLHVAQGKQFRERHPGKTTPTQTLSPLLRLGGVAPKTRMAQPRADGCNPVGDVGAKEIGKAERQLQKSGDSRDATSDLTPVPPLHPMERGPGGGVRKLQDCATSAIASGKLEFQMTQPGKAGAEG